MAISKWKSPLLLILLGFNCSPNIYNVFLYKSKIEKFPIEYFVSTSRKWYIDFNAFMEKINPRHINARVAIPRLRWHDDSVRNFKRTHPELEGATLTVAEQAFRSDRVFKTLNGHRWIINYDQLEQEVISILKAKQPPK